MSATEPHREGHLTHGEPRGVTATSAVPRASSDAAQDAAARAGVAPGTGLNPSVAAAPPRYWRNWVIHLLAAGKSRIAGLGVVLVVGFLLGLGAIAGFATLAENVAEQSTQQLDNAVLASLTRYSSPALDSAAAAMSFMGSEAVLGLLVGLTALFAFQRRWGSATMLLLVTLGAQMLNNVLKDLFHRTRPAPVTGLIPAQAFSFPSGHAMVSAAFYLFLAYVTWRLLRGWTRLVWTGLLVVLVLLIGLSRLYLGVHYFTDVVAGYVAGFLWTDAVILGSHVLQRRREGPPGTDGEAGAATAAEAAVPTAAHLPR